MNLAVLAVNLPLAAGCAAPSSPPGARLVGPGPAPFSTSPRQGWGESFAPLPSLARPRGLAPPTLPAGPPLAAPPLASSGLVEEVGAIDLSGAAIEEGRGAALDARMEEFSSADRRRWGLALLSAAELFGDESREGLCEFPELRAPIEHQGEDWEASLAVYSYTAFLGDPTPMWVSISAGCAAAIPANAGDVDAAVASGACAEDEARTFFAPGSACRTCVEARAGDYAGCLEDGECPGDAPLAVWVENPETGEHIWYRGVYAEAWGCAPDWLAQVYLLADYGEDGVLPAAFDHDRWAWLCSPFWDEEAGEPAMSCTGSEDPAQRGTLAEGLFGFVSGMRPAGGEGQAWRGRQYFVGSVSFSVGARISRFWAYNPGLGAISAPRVIADSNGDGMVGPGDDDWGFGSGGFGLNPRETRPDGSPMGRDWLAVATMKTATLIDGVPIYVYQASRCAEWVEEAGRQRCLRMGEPEGGWLNDGYSAWVDDARTRGLAYPLATLASTGHIDPDAPAGLVTHVAGAPALALPGFDDCALPHRFEPDLAPFEDQPLGWGGGAALDGQTWRFDGKDEDFRLVLHTNRPRGWCGGDASGPGRSGLDL